MESIGFWGLFHLFVFAMIYLDLKVLHRNVKERTLGSVAVSCVFWVLLAIGFDVWIGLDRGVDQAITFLTAYFLEASLSIDNLFLFLVVFSFCKIEEKYQQKVLCLGILGALVFRLLFIWLGLSLLQHFLWMYFVFGAILCFSAICFLRQKEEETDLSKSWILKLTKRAIAIEEGDHQGKFFVKKQGKRHATMLFLALVIIEVSDVLFAVDSIPAVLAVTSDLFLAYTSNVFAILGLRSFYFLLSHLKKQFVHLKTGVAVILFFVGIKLILVPFYKIPSLITLAFTAAILLTAVLLSSYSNSIKKGQ